MILKREMSFDMLVTLMKKNHGVVLCGRDGEPSIEITLEKGEHPEDLQEALNFLENEWENL